MGSYLTSSSRSCFVTHVQASWNLHTLADGFTIGLAFVYKFPFYFLPIRLRGRDVTFPRTTLRVPLRSITAETGPGQRPDLQQYLLVDRSCLLHGHHLVPPPRIRRVEPQHWNSHPLDCAAERNRTAKIAKVKLFKDMHPPGDEIFSPPPDRVSLCSSP